MVKYATPPTFISVKKTSLRVANLSEKTNVNLMEKYAVHFLPFAAPILPNPTLILFSVTAAQNDVIKNIVARTACFRAR